MQYVSMLPYACTQRRGARRVIALHERLCERKQWREVAKRARRGRNEYAHPDWRRGASRCAATDAMQ